MEKAPANVDVYLAQGCGRCELGGTPGCKVHIWPEELKALRRILLETELKEQIKWGNPCYTYKGANVLTLSALKEFVAISFFKGALLEDVHGVLEKPGPNSQAARYFRFTHLNDIPDHERTIKAYVAEAIELEKSGKEVVFKDVTEYDVPEELQRKFDDDPAFRSAFDALTPGRQKGYLIFISSAKQSQTRENRIEKVSPRIFEGLGLHDR